MPADRILPQPASAAPGHPLRVEYLGFRNLADHREYRLAVFGPDGPAEFLFRIPFAAFGAERVRLQEGPDICYQRLVNAVAAGETVSPDGVTISEADLASYREAHRPAPRRRPETAASTPKSPSVPPLRPPTRPRLPQLPAPTEAAGGPRLAKGQRISHGTFGLGVVLSSSGGRTVVCFDEGGTKRFVTSIVDLEVRSAPDTWETGPRGKNRPREAGLGERRDLPGEGDPVRLVARDPNAAD